MRTELIMLLCNKLTHARSISGYVIIESVLVHTSLSSC